MASTEPALLTDGEIEILTNQIFPGLLGEPSPTLDILEKELASTRSLRSCVNAVNSASGTSATDQAKLSLILSVYDFSESDVSVVTFSLLHPQLSKFASGAAISIQDLTEHIFTIAAKNEGVPSGHEKAWLNLRTKLFTEEPTAALCGLLSARIIAVPDDQDQAVLSVLRILMNTYELNIAKQPLGKLLGDDQLEESENTDPQETQDKGVEVVDTTDKPLDEGVVPEPVADDAALKEDNDTRAETEGYDTGTQELSEAPDEKPVDVFEAAAVPKQQRGPIRKYLFALQRLQALVSEPEDISALLACGYDSAVMVSSMGDVGLQAIVEQGVPHDRAERIRNHAMVVAVHDENVWASALKVRGTGSSTDVSLAAVGVVMTNSTTEGSSPRNMTRMGGNTPEAAEINLTTMFGMESMGCEECSSITGPAAYFVDLLQTLKGIRVDSSTTLLDKLFARRPDLGDLKLSCANIKGLVPYIDLVNEVLESVVSGGKAQPYNTDEDTTDDESAAQPNNVNYQMYQTLIQPCVFPMHTFPYNQAIDSMRTYLDATGVSRAELLATLQTPFKMMKDDNVPKAMAQEVFDYALSAEILNLQHEDFVAITQQGFQSLYYVQYQQKMVYEDYLVFIGRKSASEYWGGDLLTIRNLKKELLPRSGLVFEELLSLLKSKFVGGLLVIESTSPSVGGPDFTGKLEHMQLSRVARLEEGRNPEKWQWDDLQKFCRLKTKLQWTVEELDALLATLRYYPDTFWTQTIISPRIVNELAAVAQLAKIAGLKPEELQPLWGEINTYGDNSLYAQRFLNKSVSLAHRVVFAIDDNGKVLQNGALLLANFLDTICGALQITVAEFHEIRVIAGLSEQLTLANISAIYRISLLCKILDMSPMAYSGLSSLFPEPSLLFGTPQTTLAVVKEFMLNEPQAIPWTLDELLFVVKGIPSVSDEKLNATSEMAIRLAISIQSSIKTARINQIGSQLMTVGVIRDIVFSVLRVQFPDIDMPVLQIALNDIIEVMAVDNKNNMQPKSGISTLQMLSVSPHVGSPTFDGFFIPPTTDVYNLSCTSIQEPKITLDGVEIKFVKPNANVPWSASSVRLTGGVPHPIIMSSMPTDFRWIGSESGGIPRADFNADVTVNRRAVTNTEMVLKKLMQISFIMERFKWLPAELEFWHNEKRFNFNDLTRENLRSIGKYTLMRDEFQVEGIHRPLIELYKWLALDSTASRDRLVAELASTTPWSEKTCLEFLQAKYSMGQYGLDNEMLAIMLDISTLSEMRATMRLVSKLNLPGLSLVNIFDLATPSRPLKMASQDFQKAALLRGGVRSRLSSTSKGGGATVLGAANDKLRTRQRTALVQYLISLPTSVEKKLNSPDKIFAHYLIDVQMGPVLQTSRIKQAISTIQLFVHRCILGTEASYGVGSHIVVGDRNWDLILRYQFWEANRRAFLYPENWIDPTLRDDKSDEFLALESAILQSKLDSESITNIIKTYIYSTNEVSNLEVLSYLWDKDKKGNNDNYNSTIHFFGRTRTLPPKYYYRKLGLGGSAAKVVAYWSPWRQMNIDVKLHDYGADGKKLAIPGSYLVPAVFQGRLFVFLPDIVLTQELPDAGKTVANDSTNFEALGKTTPSTTFPATRWEIKMAFSEFQNGKWSPKTTYLPTMHILPNEKTKKLPSISDFKFWISQEWSDAINQNVLAIEVEPTARLAYNHKLVPDPPGQVLNWKWVYDTKSLGRFEMRGQHLTLVDNEGMPTSDIISGDLTDPRAGTIPTTFSRLCYRRGDKTDSAWKPSEPLDNMTGYSTPLLPLVTSYDPQKQPQHQWTISFDRLNSVAPTGLVFDLTTKPRIQTFFAFPPQRYNDKEEFNVTMVSERFEDLVTSQLVKQMNTSTGLDAIYKGLSGLSVDSYHDAFGGRNSVIFHEKSTPFALSNWEIGVHIPTLLVERLMATQQYDLALKIARLVFDPTALGTSVNRSWSFPPFRDERIRTFDSSSVTNDNITQLTTDEWRANKSNVHAAARGDPKAYMKRIAMKYIETLLARGDQHFRQGTLESMPLAIQQYAEASEIFGPQPVTIQRLGKTVIKTYNQIEADLNSLSNANVALELEFPFWSDPAKRGSDSSAPKPLGIFQTGYFCVAANPQLLTLRTLIDDRLYKIRNGLDINGKAKRYALFEPKLDPGALVNALAGAGGMSVGGLLADLESPMPNYRFSYLIERATDLVTELKSSASELLEIKEKKDAEALSLLIDKHQAATFALAVRIKEHQKTEILKAIESLDESRKQQEMRLEYFLRLTGDTKPAPLKNELWEDIEQAIDTPSKNGLRASLCEDEEMVKSDQADGLAMGAGALEATAAILNAIPVFTTQIQPFGVGAAVTIDSSNIAEGLSCAANVITIAADHMAHEAEQAARKATLIRQLQERRLEANTAGREIVKIDRDIAELEARCKTADEDMKAYELDVKNSTAEAEWRRTKYTGQQLYASLDLSLSTLLHQHYLMAVDMMKVAQRALDFEHAVRFPNSNAPSGKFVRSSASYWENSKDGQLTGHALYLDLQRMKTMHMENPTHDFNILKHVSLKEIDPWALLQLRESGSASFDIPEVLFDMDFPGHYCRRVSSVSLSILCDAGRYVSVNCSLSLYRHTYRISNLATAGTYTTDDDTSFRTDNIPITAVAASGGSETAGSFDLAFDGSELYGPFEGAGAISSWSINMPSEMRQFDYNSITDVVLHMKYTSVFGGGPLAEVATKSVSNYFKNGPTTTVIAIDLKNEYPEQWKDIVAKKGVLTLTDVTKLLPFWMRGARVVVNMVTLLLYPKPETALGTVTVEVAPKSTTLVQAGAPSVGSYYSVSNPMNAGLAIGDIWKVSGLGENAAYERGWLMLSDITYQPKA